jgi:hypothetical protein
MAKLESSDTPTPRVSPQLIVGAVSPLWSYFGAAAAGGVAYWWMTRWTQPVNLEALFDRTLKAMTTVTPPLPSTEVVEKAADAVSEAVVTAATTVLEPVLEPLPVVAPASEAAPPTEPTPQAAPDAATDARPKPRKPVAQPSNEA